MAAAGAPPPSVRLEQLTSPEVKEAVAAGMTVAIVPIGGTEQNGPHMVLGKHNTRARLMAERIARELGNALVAPVVAYVPEGAIDPPAAHMRFAGTLTVPEPAFEKSLESVARSLRHHGFRTVVLLGDHGGYRRSLQRVASSVPGVFAAPEYYREMDHAGLDDTAMALALDPTLVRADRIGKPRPGDGVQGDPTGADAARGNRLVEETIARTVTAIRKAAARPVK